MLRGATIGELPISSPFAVKVVVVVDVASLAHAIGAAEIERSTRAGSRSSYVAPHLGTLAAVLEHRGFEVLQFQVAVPTRLVDTPSNVDAGTSRVPAGWAVRRARQWIAEQRAALGKVGIPLVVLPGGHDGTSEVGVDVAAACGTLVAASEILTGSSQADAIIVVTHDSDLHLLCAAAHPARVIIAGGYDRDARRRLQDDGSQFVDVTDDELRLLSQWRDPALLSASLSPGRNTAGDLPVIEQEITGCVVVEQPTDSCVVIADPYGVACSAMTILGESDLPTMESIRTSLAHFGVDSDTPILATVPDIDFNGSHGNGSHERRHRHAAWRRHDDELDRLAQTFDDDADADTRVKRARLPLIRLPDEHFAVQRSVSHRVIKKLATQMVCDVYRCLLTSSARNIIVLTDSADVTWALHLIHTFGLDASRVVRIGTVESPIRQWSGGRPKTLDVRTSVLETGQLAALTRVTQLSPR